MGDVRYSRARFTARLPRKRLYTASHYWLEQDGESGVWRIGFTRFATRMLGDMVECGFEVEPGAALNTGQTIGWLEGFKAVTDLYAVVDGAFVCGNPALTTDIELVQSKPHGSGWLYSATGTPDPSATGVTEYVDVLDATIDRMLEGESA